MKATKINGLDLYQSQEILRAIAHPLRMKILQFIDKHKTVNVNKIYQTLKLEQSITSQHLRILRLADVVKAERQGKFIRYSVNYEKVGQVVDSVETFLNEES